MKMDKSVILVVSFVKIITTYEVFSVRIEIVNNVK